MYKTPKATCPECGSENLMVKKIIIDRETIYQRVAREVSCAKCDYVKIMPVT